MKRLTRPLAVFLAALPLCGCAQDVVPQQEPRMDTGKTALVACFSATGTTKGVAERLAGAIGASFFEIVPAQPYTAADLNWHDSQSRTSVEMGDRASRPAIAGAAPDLAAGDVVYLGFPIWWGREPSIIDTFVESNAAVLSGKTVIPFATSGSSGMGGTSANLRVLAPEARVVEGRRFPASVSAEELAAWAKEAAAQ